MSKPTPGPWNVERFTLVVSHWYQTRVADVSGGNADERAANAHLIAAAPELLEALRGMLRYDSMSAMLSLPVGKAHRDLHTAAEAAIAKAEGRA